MFSPIRVSLALGIVALTGSLHAEPIEPAPKSREFLFTYQATVTGLKPGQSARIWLPVPSSSDDQEVAIVKQVSSVEGKIEKESKYGNQIFFLEPKANLEGNIVVAITYRVKRLEVRSALKGKSDEKADSGLFLKADEKVPIGGKGLSLIKDKTLPDDAMEAARVLYDAVNAHMRYSKEGTGWGRGDSDWACDSGYGNCTDFHSLFISLARYRKIPAKFEMGFSLPEKRGQGEIAGYHCWAKFKPEGSGWIPVDISEANKNPKLKDYYFGNLTEDRVAFSVGRDLTLVPKQEGPPLNFFVYPYVEVDGKKYADENVKRRVSFEDVAGEKK